jgi:hypothetical protein
LDDALDDVMELTVVLIVILYTSKCLSGSTEYMDRIHGPNTWTEYMDRISPQYISSPPKQHAKQVVHGTTDARGVAASVAASQPMPTTDSSMSAAQAAAAGVDESMDEIRREYNDEPYPAETGTDSGVGNAAPGNAPAMAAAAAVEGVKDRHVLEKHANRVAHVPRQSDARIKTVKSATSRHVRQMASTSRSASHKVSHGTTKEYAADLGASSTSAWV